MSLKARLAICAGKLTKFALKTMGKPGSSLPGKIASDIDKDVLKYLSKDMKVVAISGTNGKTLTTAMITKILEEKYHVVTNESGSNMVQGITTSLMLNKKSKTKPNVAVLEIDEANLAIIQKSIKYDYLVFTNVFRDQMDRYGEIYTTYRYMTNGVKEDPSTVIVANGDLPIFNSDDLKNPKVFYGFDHESHDQVIPHYNNDGLLCPSCKNAILSYTMNTYANMGAYKCEACGFERPDLKYRVSEIKHLDLYKSTFDIDGHEFTIDQAGLYNVYNALAAYSLAKEFGMTDDQIQRGFSSLEKKFGRQESFDYKGKKVMINLTKNPVGFDQIINLLALNENKKTVIALLNDNYADGRDVSWIWDGDYEKMQDLNITDIHAGGIRKDDLALRLKVAGFDKVNMINGFEDILKVIENSPNDQVFILSTYTALLELKENLGKRKIAGGDLK